MRELNLENKTLHYQHSREIHERIDEVLRLIESGSYSTPALSGEIGVSIPTISRIVAVLQEQGHVIRAKRTSNGWCYVLTQVKVPKTNDSDNETASHVGRKAIRYAH
jgi:DeoR/GlpR family transcriptional regulator of sugar metabolism